MSGDTPLLNFGAYRHEFSSSIHQLVGLGGLFSQLNVTEQESLVTTIKTGQDALHGSQRVWR